MLKTLQGRRRGKNDRMPGKEVATQVATSATKTTQADHEDDLAASADAWATLRKTLELSRQTEEQSQAGADSARWKQAEIVAGLYGRWGHDGLTFKAIASRFGEPQSTIKLHLGMYKEFGVRSDLGKRRFSDWHQIYEGIRSELKALGRLVPDESSHEKLRAAVDKKLSDVVSEVVADEALNSTAQSYSPSTT